MMTQNRKTSFLFGDNVPYIEQLYESFLADAGSVSEEWRGYFEALQSAPAVDGSARSDVPHAAVIDKFVAMAKHARPAANEGAALAFAKKQVAVQALVAAYRMVGTRQALLDPLQWSPTPPLPELTPAYYGLTQNDLATRFSTADTYFWDADSAPLKDIVTALKETYCGTLGAEYMYLADAGQRQWWQMRLESARAKPALTPPQRKRILERLTAAEGLEKYLHTRYVGQKRFSLEGGEALIVLLDEMLRAGAAHGIKTAMLGMAHRGRLNVLVNTVGKPARMLFDEFEGKTARLLPAGDVKYHKGYTGTMETDDGAVEIILAFNASHLEIVNPVVQGIARGKAEQMDVLEEGAVLPVEIHGDVAISGQGIVMETMNLSYTKGHGTGGTIHIVINNQIGFTTSDPSETRSTHYCTDIAKLIEAPVLHVNADDPEAVVEAVRLAVEYRATYKCSVVIDLVCFRRHGHQEQDTPGITQPMMYRSIASHPGARSIYARRLAEAGVVSGEQADDYVNAYRDALAGAGAAVEKSAAALPSQVAAASKAGPYAAPALAVIEQLAHRISEVPDGYALHPLVSKVVAGRREMADGLRPLDWGMGEHLAFASLLAAGIHVRLSGQDSERGTFSHRHAVLNNQDRQVRGEGKYVPLNHVSADQGRFTVNNSILSESAVLAFEYGYSAVRDDALVMWEAQFGDFANGAQVIVDNFIVAAAAKWGQSNGITMLLPHGQEGTGPEHASARLERYLQLCAQENIQVCQPTLPAQFFHLLRRQATAADRKPLIVMTPKSLLRHPEAGSALADLAGGRFREVLGDETIEQSRTQEVERAIVCSGKVYFDLVEYRRAHGLHNAALIRVEQLYPFPAAQLEAELARYRNVEKVVWCQEEPRNQGAWKVLEEDLAAVVPKLAVLRDSSRDASPSTAPGYPSLHLEQQANLVKRAFAI
ncbi:2-oxoglutarate dehydrogenase E1 component [Rugamonas sp.]|uniref:2-oxoglutarate dehydrogenase E1 component n=1 Tax=Rugamonas sp. TaxID=1926287 RepID=UPI0025E5696A|nr:2-oxoglutarate dehydrogenase E1 component [Rugamonas sp.]